MPSNCTGSAGHYCPDVLLATLACRHRPGLLSGHNAMLITFYRFIQPRSKRVDGRVGWIGFMPGVRPSAVCQPFMTGSRQEPFSSLILARFAGYCHPDLLPERSSVAPSRFIPASLPADGGKACLTIPFICLFAMGKSQNPASLYQTLFESANKNVFW